MGNIVIIVAVICMAFFVWARMDYKRRKRENNKRRSKPPFRSEEDLKGYEKPLKNGDYNPVDFDDAE